MQSVVSVVKDETMTGDSGHMPLMIYNMFGYDGQVKPVQSSLKKGEQLDVNVKCIANMSTVHDFNGGISVADLRRGLQLRGILDNQECRDSGRQHDQAPT